MLIHIDIWPDDNVFVYCTEPRMKPDLAFQRYVTGMEKPNYPVPALREDIIGGGIKNHCLQIGATYVDVSRGELEIY